MSTEALEVVALPEPVARRGITEPQWRTLANNLFPGASPHSVLMVWDYCIARKLDPMKKPCHIVPMRVKDGKTGEWGWRDVVMPGIYEYRTTAQRTGEYLGHSKPEYGPIVEHLGVKAPEWCELTIYRATKHGSGRAEFPVRRFFAEVVGLTKDAKVNDRWSRAPIQMLEKCTEAAGLREAFPDEFGGEPIADEMDDQRVIVELKPVAPAPQPAQRKSQQQTPPAPAEASLPQATADVSPQPAAPADPPKHIGVIVAVDVMANGTLIKLDTGFRAATKDESVIRGAMMARDQKFRIELLTKAPSNSKYAPIVTDIRPLEVSE